MCPSKINLIFGSQVSHPTLTSKLMQLELYRTVDGIRAHKNHLNNYRILLNSLLDNKTNGQFTTLRSCCKGNHKHKMWSDSVAVTKENIRKVSTLFVYSEIAYFLNRVYRQVQLNNK